MKKLFSVLLCLALLAGISAPGMNCPLFLTKASAASEELSKAVAPEGSEPAGFANAKDPYNLAGTDEFKSIAVQSELMLSVNSTDGLEYRIGDNFNPAKIDGSDAFNMDNGSAYFKTTDGASPSVKEIHYSRSAAIDSDGDGQRESVVYIGWRPSDKKIVAWTINAKTKQTSGLLDLGKSGDAVYQLYYKAAVYRMEATYQALNFFSIAAGDFNGDGKETAFAAIPSGNDDRMSPQMVELSVSGNTISKKSGGYGNYLNRAFFDDDEIGIATSGDYEDMLSVQIASGDFNGDEKDDLAVLSYTNDISSTYDDEDYIDLYCPRLTVGFGAESGLPSSPALSKQVINNRTTSDDYNYWDMPIAGNVTSADIDADGLDEIVLAGYYGQVCGKTSNKDYYMDDGSRTASNLIYVTYDADSSLSVKSWEKKEPNKWTATTGESVSGVWLSQDWVWQPIGMGAAKIDGRGSKEYVFISGSLYQFANGKLNSVYTPDYFNAEDHANDGASVSVTFISSVDSGVLDGNYKSYEQLSFTVGLKLSSQHRYHYLVGIIGKKDIDNSGHISRQFYCNNIEDSKTYAGSHYTASVNAVDCDDDIIKVRYNSKSYGWSDPAVIGVLQAAPYFGELGTFDDFNDGSTTLTMSTAYESEYAQTCSQSLGVGALFEVDTDVFEMEIKAGYSGAWSQTSFSTTSSSQAFSVTAGANDTVIVRRTPVYDFSYDIWDAATDKWLPDAYHINIVKESVYYTFSVDEYNTFAQLYNRLMRAEYGNDFKAFKEITKENAPYLIGNEGNPHVYLNGSVGAMSAALGHNGGSQAISYENSYGSGSSTSEENGFSFELSACGGTDKVKFGGYVTSEFMWGYETTETEISGKGTEGAVANINDADTAEATGSPASLVHQYGFNWSFGTWDLDLGGNERVPVYGYYVADITGPSPRVTDLAYEPTNGGTELSFTWSKPQTDGRTEIAGYNLYKSVEGGEFAKVNDTLITEESFIVTQEQFDRTKGTVFAVTSAIRKEYPTGEDYYSEGLFSNHCRFNGDLSGRSAYEIALDEGFEGSLSDWFDSLKGASVIKVEKTDENGLVDTYTITFSDKTTADFHITNGADGASAFEIAQANGYTGTVEQWLTLIGADCAQGHAYVSFTMPASCGRPGYSLDVCAKCGSGRLTTAEALSHHYTATVVPASHTMCGYTRYTCENCGDTYCDNLTAITDHTYTVRIVNPTCVQSGYTEKTCTECGIVIRTDVVPAYGHHYQTTVTEPDCAHYGYTTYRCKDCGQEYVSDVTPATDHEFRTKVIRSTCSAGGYTIKYCTQCGFSVIEDETEAKGHRFEVTKVFMPTCTSEGYSVYTCAECGVNKIADETAPIAHIHGEWVCEDPATGRYVRRCENCYKLLDTKTVAIVSGDGGSEDALNPNIDENGVLNIGYRQSEKITLKVDGLASSTVVYTSSDPKVATVDSEGNVTATGPGSAVISASIPGTAIATQVSIQVKPTWWQKIHYLLNQSLFFRLLFMLFGVEVRI